MSITSKKLYKQKNADLKNKVKKIDVKNNEELLLLEAPSQYDEMYRTLNVPSKQDFVKDQLKSSREIKIYEKRYEKEAFKGYHIKKMCNKYDLMILPISEVRGYLGEDSMKALSDFKENKNVLLTDATIYILAPRECFYGSYFGKEVKTFILFYKSNSNQNGGSYRRVSESDTINQIYSSGKDFSMFRVFNQLLLTKRYEGGDGMARLYSNILISLILLISIPLGLSGYFITGFVFMVIYLVSMYFNNSVDSYKECWNKYSERHYHD